MHKWSSNHPNILADVPIEHCQLDELEFEWQGCSIKALGLTLDAKKDCFIIKAPKNVITPMITKRIILSKIAELYDPLGFVSPIVVQAKLIMQKLWLEKINWDDTPSQGLIEEWLKFANNLSNMQPIHFNRNIHIPSHTDTVQLIGFADASSTTGYGCCIYLRTVDHQGKVTLSLLCSKSRINPCAKPLSIPRLELNANLLLAHLMTKVYNTLIIKIKITGVYLFSDSKVALAWIETDVTKLQPYISNRVRIIKQITHRWQWLYVQSQENPADFLSRGLSPQEISCCSMWWNGPTFLQSREYNFEPQPISLPDHLPELKSGLHSADKMKANVAKQLMGSLPRQRVTASRAFHIVGVDFAGPVQVKNSRIRRAIVSKGYPALRDLLLEEHCPPRSSVTMEVPFAAQRTN
ncbi:uncharacterized protein [Epargyreus clarus]|uniref:uncharacterized protein n=1 Tax=Epargyreus clarus TaxID=520877 RepID=UPI003C2CCDF1